MRSSSGDPHHFLRGLVSSTPNLLTKPPKPSWAVCYPGHKRAVLRWRSPQALLMPGLPACVLWTLPPHRKGQGAADRASRHRQGRTWEQQRALKIFHRLAPKSGRSLSGPWSNSGSWNPNPGKAVRWAGELWVAQVKLPYPDTLSKADFCTQKLTPRSPQKIWWTQPLCLALITTCSLVPFRLSS